MFVDKCTMQPSCLGIESWFLEVNLHSKTEICKTDYLFLTNDIEMVSKHLDAAAE